jgi:hypothetical protein
MIYSMASVSSALFLRVCENAAQQTQDTAEP